MNKSDLVDLLAKKEGLTEASAKRIVDMAFDGFTETLKSGGRIEIRGFGSFVVKNYKAYTGRNPKSGKGIPVKPKKLPFFKVGKELKEKVDI
jgi:integration host factor subunit beta